MFEIIKYIIIGYLAVGSYLMFLLTPMRDELSKSEEPKIEIHPLIHIIMPEQEMIPQR